MSYVVNVGEIKVDDQPFNEEAKKIIKETLGIGFYSVDRYFIEFDEYYDKYFCETAKLLISKLAPLGYLLNGSVEYYGDWSGMIVITNNDVLEYNSDQWRIKQTSDNELIEELVSRGYKVTKEANDET